MADVTRLYAWLGEDEHGDDGIITLPNPGGGFLPLVCTSELLARKIGEQAFMAMVMRAKPVRLVEFTVTGEPLDVIAPPG